MGPSAVRSLPSPGCPLWRAMPRPPYAGGNRRGHDQSQRGQALPPRPHLTHLTAVGTDPKSGSRPTRPGPRGDRLRDGQGGSKGGARGQAPREAKGQGGQARACPPDWGMEIGRGALGAPKGLRCVAPGATGGSGYPPMTSAPKRARVTGHVEAPRSAAAVGTDPKSRRFGGPGSGRGPKGIKGDRHSPPAAARPHGARGDRHCPPLCGAESGPSVMA